MEPTEDWARRADERDPLRGYRDRFLIPPASAITGEAGDTQDSIYLVGNSLGCQPRGVREAVEAELDAWAGLGVEAHMRGCHPWYSYHERFRERGARLVGARPGEVVMMNGLTVNLHLMMVSFYRPTRERYRIVIEDDAFGSDSYAVQSQARWHGLDPEDAIVRLRPREGERVVRTEDVEAFLVEHSETIALVLLGGVNYLTGQLFDLERITRAGHGIGAVVGWDLAHAAGNVPLQLHDWGVDFASWCSYKYLNAGPGAVAGCFIHERHARNTGLDRLAGWWGNDPETRFRMDRAFRPVQSADAWQLSNPPILSMAPLDVSLEIFDEAGMPALRAKSESLTGFLELLLRDAPGVSIVTPTDPTRRGCQLSLRFAGDARELHAALGREGVVADFREPDVLRVAPVPLYNTFTDVWRFAQLVRRVAAG